MSSSYQDKLGQAKTYVLAHPTESKQQQAAGANVSVTLIAQARRELIAEGKLEPSRKADPFAKPPDVAKDLAKPALGPPTRPSRTGGTLDHDAMAAIGEMVDAMMENGDDTTVQKALIRQCLIFANNPSLHPDTRMSASQMYMKLKSLSQTRDLGPGKPMTRQAAIERLRDLLIAAGPVITRAAINLAFNRESTNGETNPGTSPSGATETPGPA